MSVFQRLERDAILLPIEMCSLLRKQIVECNLALHHAAVASGHDAKGGDESGDEGLAGVGLSAEEGLAVA